MDKSAEEIELRTELARLQVAFASTIPLMETSTPVPWCGSWTVLELVEHLAYVHHWAAAMARNEDARPLSSLGELPSKSELRSGTRSAPPSCARRWPGWIPRRRRGP